MRIVLSLTPTDRLEKDIYLGHSIVALRDVALATDPLVVDPANSAVESSGSVTRDDQQISDRSRRRRGHCPWQQVQVHWC